MAANEPQFSNTTFVILAQGQARRMSGAPKGLISIDGVSIYDRLLSVAAPFGEIDVVTRDPLYERPSVKTVSDRILNRGPLGGIFTALTTSAFEWSLVVACDMPFIRAQLLSPLFAGLTLTHDAAVYENEGRIEPFPLLVRSNVGESLRSLAEQGASIRDALGVLQTCRIDAKLYIEETYRNIAFSSVNTPDDVRSATKAAAFFLNQG